MPLPARLSCKRKALPLPALPTGATPTAAFLVDHAEGAYYDLYRERKAHLKSVDEEVGPRPWLAGLGRCTAEAPAPAGAPRHPSLRGVWMGAAGSTLEGSFFAEERHGRCRAGHERPEAAKPGQPNRFHPPAPIYAPCHFSQSDCQLRRQRGRRSEASGRLWSPACLPPSPDAGGRDAGRGRRQGASAQPGSGLLFQGTAPAGCLLCGCTAWLLLWGRLTSPRHCMPLLGGL